MTSSQTCERCGKKLIPGLGPDGPIHLEMTAETICGECMMNMLESISPPLDDDLDVKIFLKKVVDELVQHTGFKSSRLLVKCKIHMAHDVEINIVDDDYQITVINDLMLDPTRWAPARDYLVTWIKEHPLSHRAWKAKRSANQDLLANGRSVFIFLPEKYPEPPVEFGAQVAKELCKPDNVTDIVWMVCPVSTASIEQHNREVNSVLSAWAIKQLQPDSLQIKVRSVKFHFAPDECTCVIVHRLM